jgi:hypothetical protein
MTRPSTRSWPRISPFAARLARRRLAPTDGESIATPSERDRVWHKEIVTLIVGGNSTAVRHGDSGRNLQNA